MKLTKLKEDATSETLGWDPVAGADGFRFTVAGKRSHTWDGSRSQVRVAKGKPVLVEALRVFDTGEWPTTEPPPVDATLVAEAVYQGAGTPNDVPLWRNHVQCKAPDRMTIVDDPLGQHGKVMRVNVRPGDSAVAGSGDGERADVYAARAATLDSEGAIIAFHTRIMLPDEFNSNGSGWNVPYGWHHTGSTGQSPVQFEIRNGGDLRVRLMGGTQQPNGLGTWRADEQLGTLARNVWHDILVGEIVSSDPTKGRIVVRVDGDTRLDRACANTYVGQGRYFKTGFYRVAQSQPTTLFHDDIAFWTADTLEAALEAAAA